MTPAKSQSGAIKEYLVRLHVAFGLLILMSPLAVRPIRADDDMPINHRALKSKKEHSAGKTGLTNYFSVEQLLDAVRDGDGSGLAVNFDHMTELLDGTKLDASKLYGELFAGPYPFESKESRFSYKRFRLHGSISAGAGKIDVSTLLRAPYNSEDWTDAGQIAVRFVLFLQSEGKDRRLGTYDITTAFKKIDKVFTKQASLLEGPFVNLVRSDDTSTAVIAFRTDRSLKGRVLIELSTEGNDGTKTAPRSFWDERATEDHEITLTGLQPDTKYDYRIQAGSVETRVHTFKTAPKLGEGRVRFAYFGDSREGTGDGSLARMGVNAQTLHDITLLADREEADFLIVGGDLVNGYTSVQADFETQLHAWRQAIAGFWHERPVYAAMGNHESLLKVFEGNIKLDNWPYDTSSAEAVFGRVFSHPTNGPEASDPRRPTYKENVYSFQYGPVKVIAFNNNYWVSYSTQYGGSPEGYLLPDQLDWIEKELDAASQDESVRYVLLFAQEPIFPNGGHISDSMWHNGDNRVRAHFFKEGKVWPAQDGVLVVRDRFLRAIHKNKKVAAVLGSDEHAYHRILIGKDVPIGDLDRDDHNKNGKIDIGLGEHASPLKDLEHNVWYLVGGGGGAPYYTRQNAPWNEYWNDRKTHASGIGGFYYSSQENILIFDANHEGIGVKVYNPQGELIDAVTNLMLDKPANSPAADPMSPDSTEASNSSTSG